MLRVHLTRDSVAAGDDVDAPHSHHVTIPARDTGVALVAEVLKLPYLPGISGGRATWVVTSHEPFAVCAQEWPEPKTLKFPVPIEQLATDGNEIRLHFSYMGQIEPKTVFDVLWYCKFSLRD